MSRNEMDRREFLRSAAAVSSAAFIPSLLGCQAVSLSGSPDQVAGPAATQGFGQTLEQGRALQLLWETQILTWRVQLPGRGGNSEDLKPIIVTDNSAFLTRATDGRFTKVNTENGQAASWPFDKAGSPLAATNEVVWMLEEGQQDIYAVSHDSGNTEEYIHLGNKLDSLPFVYGDEIYLIDRYLAPGNQSYFVLKAININTGQTEERFRIDPIKSRSRETQIKIDGMKGWHIGNVTESFIRFTGSVGDLIIDRKTGKIIWEYLRDWGANWAGVSDDKILLLESSGRGPASYSFKFKALERNGNELWTSSASIPLSLDYFRTIFSNMFIASSQDKKRLSTVNLMNGEPDWTTDELGTPSRLTYSDQQGMIYLLTFGGPTDVFAFNTRGKMMWKKRSGESPVFSKTTPIENEVVIHEYTKLHFLDPKTGNPTRPSVENEKMNVDNISPHNGKLLIYGMSNDMAEYGRNMTEGRRELVVFA